MKILHISLNVGVIQSRTFEGLQTCSFGLGVVCDVDKPMMNKVSAITGDIMDEAECTAAPHCHVHDGCSNENVHVGACVESCDLMDTEECAAAAYCHTHNGF